MQRWSNYLELPLNLHPKYFPVSGDAAAKLIIATNIAHGTDKAMQLTEALMQAVWTEDRNLADNDTLLLIANLHELDGKALMKSADTATVQAHYDRNTDAAMEANVFGAPWFVIDGEGYWGQDRLDFVARALAG